MTRFQRHDNVRPTSGALQIGRYLAIMLSHAGLEVAPEFRNN